MAKIAKNAKTEALATKPKAAPIQQNGPLEDWEIELQKKVQAQKAAETSGGLPRITHEDGILSIDGNAVKDNKVRGIVAGYVFSKSYFPNPYKKGVAQTATCYAFGRPEGGEGAMCPMEDAPDQQNPTCKGCEHNVFGTAFQGNGKRCKDERQLAIISEVEDTEALAAAEVRVINVPPGSLKNWGNYLKKLDQITSHGVYGVVTEIGIEKLGGGHALTFKPVEPITDRSVIKSLVMNSSKVEDSLIRPWPKLNEDEAPKAKPNAKRAAKVR